MGQVQPVKQKHDKSLWILFGTEMWERFGYYLISAIFLLYLKDLKSNGGAGFDLKKATDLLGTYIALVYLSPFVGGMLADRYLGYRRSIVVGAALLAAGYYCLVIPGQTAMYIALLLLVIGNGFFKPNISTLLGNIYSREELKAKKDMAYNIFYMGVNVGALVSPFVAAYMRNHYSWRYAFLAAGVGMTLSLIWFIAGYNKVAEGDVKKPLQPGDMPMSKILGVVFLPAIAAAVIGWYMERMTGHTLFGSNSNDAFMLACVPIIIFYANLFRRAKSDDRRGLGALFAFFLVAIVFWVIYNQNTTGLTIWADQYTDRAMPAAADKIAGSFGALQSVTTAPHEVIKYDAFLRTQSASDGSVLKTIGPDSYFNNLPQKDWPADGRLHLLSTEIFQSVNPLFIILFTPLLVLIFNRLAKRRREPNTPVKVGLGIWFAGLSSLLMYIAVITTDIYHNKSDAMWVVGTYGIFTIGELLVSPIGLSMVSKLSPPRNTAMMMGAWFIIVAISGKLAGLMATYWDSFIHKENYFLILVIAAAIAGVIMFAMSKWLAGVIKEKTGGE